MKVFVVGAGVMATGIIQVFAMGDHEVIYTDISEQAMKNTHKIIDRNLSKLVDKEKISEEQKYSILRKISSTQDYSYAKDVDLVIEAVAEKMEIKKDIFNKLNNICDEKTIFATNTSSLSITEMAIFSGRPDKFIGVHFFNPAPVMKLVEIIKGFATSKEVEDFIVLLVKGLKKEAVICEEAPGFIVNRILQPMINEAIGILADGVATKEGIDDAMKFGANHPIGPLALADLCGLDIVCAIMDVLYDEYKDPKYRAHTMLRKMVRAGKLGRKTGEGFYKY